MNTTAASWAKRCARGAQRADSTRAVAKQTRAPRHNHTTPRPRPPRRFRHTSSVVDSGHRLTTSFVA